MRFCPRSVRLKGALFSMAGRYQGALASALTGMKLPKNVAQICVVVKESLNQLEFRGASSMLQKHVVEIADNCVDVVGGSFTIFQ